MKNCAFVSLLMVSGLLIAAPKAEWIPAKADVAAVAVGINQENPEVEKAYEAAFKAAGIDLDFDNADTQKKLAETCPGLDVLVKELFGIADDWASMKAESLLVSAVLPTSEKAADGKAFIYVELPGFKQDAADAALKQVLAKDAKGTLTRVGGWSVIKSEDADDDDVFMGYRAIPEGYVVAVAAKQADADAHLAGKNTLAKDAPLQQLFANLPKQGSRAMIADIKGLVTRYADADDLKGLKVQAPWLLKLGSVTVDTVYEGTTAVVKFAAQMADAQAATVLRDSVIAMKTMAATFMVPQFTGNPSSAISKLCLNQMTCEAKGTVAELKITCTPEEAAALVKEVQGLQSLISCAPISELDDGEAIEALDIEELLEEDFDDDDDEKMTPEEARRILDSLE